MNINKSNQQIFIHKRAMYKTRNTGTGNGMQGTRVMGECYISGSVAKHSGECPQTFRGMSLKHSSFSEQPNSTYISILF